MSVININDKLKEKKDDNNITSLNNPQNIRTVPNSPVEYYKSLPDKTKLDIDFVIDYIKKFNSTKNLVNEVFNYFFHHSDDADEIFDLTCEILKITKQNEIVYQQCFYVREKLFSQARNVIKRIAEEENLGIGFAIAKEKYVNSSEMLERLIASYLIDIFGYDGENIEKLVHSKCTSEEHLNAVGINKFLLDCVREKDEELASYLSIRINNLTPYYKKTCEVVKNWSNYEIEKYYQIADEVHEYMEDDYYLDDESTLSELDLITLISKQLNLSYKEFSLISGGFVKESDYNNVNCQYLEQIRHNNSSDEENYNAVAEIFENHIGRRVSNISIVLPLNDVSTLENNSFKASSDNLQNRNIRLLDRKEK